MPAHRAILAALIFAAACSAPTEPSGPTGPVLPAGRYELTHMQGEPVPGWVRSLCRTAVVCEASLVHGGTLEFPGGKGCIWTLDTPAGLERQDGLDCMLIVAGRSVEVRIGMVTRLLSVTGTGLTLTYTTN